MSKKYYGIVINNDADNTNSTAYQISTDIYETKEDAINALIKQIDNIFPHNNITEVEFHHLPGVVYWIDAKDLDKKEFHDFGIVELTLHKEN